MIRFHEKSLIFILFQGKYSNIVFWHVYPWQPTHTYSLESIIFKWINKYVKFNIVNIFTKLFQISLNTKPIMHLKQID